MSFLGWMGLGTVRLGLDYGLPTIYCWYWPEHLQQGVRWFSKIQAYSPGNRSQSFAVFLNSGGRQHYYNIEMERSRQGKLFFFPRSLLWTINSGKKIQ